MPENKQEFIAGLGLLLNTHTDSGVRKVNYIQDGDGFETVEIIFKDNNRPASIIIINDQSCAQIMRKIAEDILLPF